MRTFVNYHALFPHLFVIAAIFLFGLFCLPIVGSAQQPTARIKSFSGDVLVSVQGKEPIAATADEILQAGDTLQTRAGAQVALTLSEGSELKIGQNTKVEIAALAQRPKTGARKSRLKLWYGQVRAFLSPGHQKEGSSFEVETLNALAGVKFSQPDFEAEYKPETKTSIFRWYTVEGTVINILTKEHKRIPKAHQAIVQDEFLWISPLVPGKEEISPTEKQQLIRTDMLLGAQQIVGGTVSTVPIVSGENKAKTSQSPGLGDPATGPQLYPVTIEMSED
jgi:hypothetical protein